MKNCLFKCLIVAIALNLFVSAYYQIADRIGHPVQKQPAEQIFQASALPEGFIEAVNFESTPGTGNIRVKTIYHRGRTYDVFYQSNDGRFFVIRAE